MSTGVAPGDVLQDPFLISAHIITDPGEAKPLQQAVDRLLSLLHPQLALFRVSERAGSAPARPRCRTHIHPSLRPCLSVILFLQGDAGCEGNHEQQLNRPPWHHHHTEHVEGSSLAPVRQDFFILAPGTPLWALRQVHYGKEIVRFTVHCRYETYSDQVRLYTLLVPRPLVQRNHMYSLFMVYSNHHMEIQLSFKRLPRGQDPAPTECTLMEIRVRNLGVLAAPLLPYPCRPISDTRWQTKDYDGNKILLQVQVSSEPSRGTIPPFPPSETPSFLSDNYQRCFCRSTSCSDAASALGRFSRVPIPLRCKQENRGSAACSQDPAGAGWTDPHRLSLLSEATESLHPASARPSTSLPCSSSCLTTPRFRINVDALLGAKETDVDTGQPVLSRSVDLSVVSAYVRPQTPRPSELFNITSSVKASNNTAPHTPHALQAKSTRSKGERGNNDSQRTKGSTGENKQEFFI